MPYYLLKISRLAMLLMLFPLLLLSCTDKADKQKGMFPNTPEAAEDLRAIIESGEVVIGTISGPDSYFELAGEALGTQYALAHNFAESQGVGLRVELAHSEEELCQLLTDGIVDLAA